MASTSAFPGDDVFKSDVFGDSLDDFDIWGDGGDVVSKSDDMNAFFSDDFGEEIESKDCTSDAEQKSKEEPPVSSTKKPHRRSHRKAAGETAKRPDSLRRRGSKHEELDGEEAEKSETGEDNQSNRISSLRPASLRRRLSKAELGDENAAENSAGDDKVRRRPSSNSRRQLFRRRLSKEDLISVDDAEAEDGKDSRKHSESRRPHSLRRRLSKDELIHDDENNKTADNESAESNNSGSGRKDTTPDPSTSTHSSRRSRLVRRNSGKARSPSQRKPGNIAKEHSMRNLITLLNSSNPELGNDEDNVEGLQASNHMATPVVSKSVHRRHDLRKSRSVRGMNRTHHEEGKYENEEIREKNEPENTEKPEKSSDAIRSPPDRSSSMRAQTSKLASAAAELGAARTRHARPDSTRNPPSRTGSTSRRTAPGRGLPSRSASFVVRRDGSGSLGHDSGSKPQSKQAIADDSQTDAAPTSHKAEASRGVGRSVSINSGRRRPPLRNDSHSGRGLHRVARGNIGQPLQRAASFRSISGVEGL